jgi:hypothetical protein
VKHFGTDQHAAFFEDVVFWSGIAPSNGYGNLTNVAVGPRGTPSESGLTNPAWGFISITPDYPGTFVRLKSLDLASFDDNNLDETGFEIFVHDEFPYVYSYWSRLGITVSGDVNNATHTHIALTNGLGSPVEGPLDVGMSVWWQARGGRVGIDNVEFEIIGPMPEILAKDDFFSVSQGATLTVAHPGVLGNDLPREPVGPLSAALLTFLL